MTRYHERPYRDYLNAKTSQHKRALPETHGLRCIDCHGAHPYNGPRRLAIDYTYIEGRVYIIWLCPLTGNPIRTVSYGN